MGRGGSPSLVVFHIFCALTIRRILLRTQIPPLFPREGAILGTDFLSPLSSLEVVL